MRHSGARVLDVCRLEPPPEGQEGRGAGLLRGVLYGADSARRGTACMPNAHRVRTCLSMCLHIYIDTCTHLNPTPPQNTTHRRFKRMAGFEVTSHRGRDDAVVGDGKVVDTHPFLGLHVSGTRRSEPVQQQHVLVTDRGVAAVVGAA